jgi:hypothetical protein
MLRPARILRTALGVRVARSLYGRWLSLPAPDRERLEPLAEDAKRLALDLRGFVDRRSAERELRAANESLAAALVESAESDPEVSDAEVSRLRDELGHELRRLAAAEAGQPPAAPGG